MANTFLSSQEIARAALPVLHNSLVFPALSYNDYSNDFGKRGDTVQIKKPPLYTAEEFGSSINVQDTKEENVLVTLDKIADVSVQLTAKEMALSIEDFTSQVIEPAALAIAEKINTDGLSLYKDIPYYCGKAGETPSDINTFATASKVLNDNKAPVSRRSAVWNSAAMVNFQTLPAVVNAEKAGNTKALREGSIGRIIGLDNYMSQQVCTHEAGTLASTATITVKTAAANGNTIVLSPGNGGTLSGTVNKGDLFKIGNKTFVATANANATSSSVTIPVYPAVPATGLSSGTEVIKVSSHAANLAFHKNAFGFVTRPLEIARGAESYVTSFDGITLRVTFAYDIATKKQTMSMDTLYGFKTLYPELAVRVLG